MNQPHHPIKLTGAKNTRELGGYFLPDGRETKTHSFLRSDTTADLTEEDISILHTYGVRCVVDLRGKLETGLAPSRLKGRTDMEYWNIPLNDRVHTGDLAGGLPENMGQMYVELLDRSSALLRQVFEVFLRFPEDCVLFHCTAGKDRTGVVSMLLLQLAGLDDETIIGDYAATEHYLPSLKKSVEDLKKSMGFDVPEYLFRSAPESMRTALDHLHTVYGGAEKYLSSLGFSSGEIAGVRGKLIAKQGHAFSEEQN